MHHLLFLDLKDDADSIAAYEAHHRAVWPEILAHIRACGISDMRIWRSGNRLAMLMETGENFSFAAMNEALARNPKAQEWETLMDTFQQRLPWAQAEEKWLPGKLIFHLGADSPPHIAAPPKNTL